MSLGQLRNGLGALQNLHRLLSSVEVDPGDLLPALVDFSKETEQLQRALANAVASLTARGASEPCVASLTRYCSEAFVDEAGSELPTRSKSRLTALQRLRLERTVQRRLKALLAVLPIVEDLSVARPAQPLAPGLAELVHSGGESQAATALGFLCPVSLYIDPAAQGRDLGVDVQTGRSLVAHCLAMTLGGAGERRMPLSVSLWAQPESEQLCTRVVAPAQGEPEASAPGELTSFRTYPAIEPTQWCVRELSTVARARVVTRPGRAQVDIFWPGAE